jgi:hypothetical protein
MKLNDFSEKVGGKLALKVDPVAMEVTKERQLAESVPSVGTRKFHRPKMANETAGFTISSQTDSLMSRSMTSGSRDRL